MKKSNSQVFVNLIANIISFAVGIFISFYTTPYITKNVGMEAYGLIGLANNFTSYITIVTAALNSMASRFIIIEIHKNNMDEANKYFNSVLFANTVAALIIIIGSLFFIPNLDSIINVSPNLIEDAKATFGLVFIGFSISLVMSVFGVVYYAKNRLDIGAWRTVESNIIRVMLLVLIFKFIGVKIQYSIVTTIISTLYVSLFSMYNTKKMMPSMKISIEFFDFKKILEMIKAGIWNSISKLSQVLLNGLDLIITNLFIGGAILGSVSVAKTFSSLIISLISTVSDVFLPKFLKAYTINKEELNKEFFESSKLLGLCSCLILSLFFVYCEKFYQIWLPGEDSVLLRNLTYVSLISISVSGSVYSMFSLFTVINKVKQQAVSSLIMSILSTITVFVLLKYTDLGVYAIVGVSAVYGALKNLIYNIVYLAKHAGIKILKCYIVVIKNLFIMTILIILNLYIQNRFEITNFMQLVMSAGISALISCVVYMIIGTSVQDKKKFIKTIKFRLTK